MTLYSWDCIRTGQNTKYVCNAYNTALTALVWPRRTRGGQQDSKNTVFEETIIGFRLVGGLRFGNKNVCERDLNGGYVGLTECKDTVTDRHRRKANVTLGIKKKKLRKKQRRIKKESNQLSKKFGRRKSNCTPSICLQLMQQDL